MRCRPLPIAVVAGIVCAPPYARAQEKFVLKSVSVDLPTSGRTFPAGPGSDAINNNCLLCHSAGMVLDQPNMSKPSWQAEVDKMLEQYKAPVDPRDVDTIVSYLVSIKGTAPASSSLPTGNGHRPDPDHGAVIAAQGLGAAVPACARCHAFNGVSDGSGAFPRIAGQSSYYLASQLQDFASGLRANPIMSPIAKAMSSDDIDDAAAYYSGVESPFLPLATASPALVERGRQLAASGDSAKDVPACNNCHGQRGTGEPPAIPYLAGQYGRYIAFELQMWQHRYRTNSPANMFAIASKLDSQENAAVAAYYQQLHVTNPVTTVEETK